MGSFIDEFMQNYGPEVTQQMAANFNLDQKTVQKIIPQLAPLIISGLKKQKDERGGEERVNHILNKYGDPSVLENINGLITKKVNDPSADVNLGGLIGTEGGVQAAQVLGKSLNIDASKIMKMIPALAPIILGALSRKRDTSNAGISGIGALLDADGDGSIIDDIAGFLMKSGTGQSRGKGVLGSLLGGLLRRK